MKRFLTLLAVAALLSSCFRTGLDDNMSKVLDKIEDDLGYVNTLEDRDVAKVADWFERRGDDDQKARALFCLGRNQFNSHSYSAAIVSYTKALDYAGKACDTLSLAKIRYDMARVCEASGNVSDQMLYLARASEDYKAAGRENESQQALLEIGLAKSGIGKSEEAENIFKSVLYDSNNLRDTLLEAHCLEAYAALAVSKDTLDPALAIDLLSRAADELGYPLSCADKGILAYAYSLTGKSAEARKWLSQARAAAESDEQTAGVNFREYQISARSGDSKAALSALERVIDYGNKSQTGVLEETVAASQREYIEEQAAAQADKLRAARLRLWVLALGALLTLAAVLAVFFASRAKERQRLEKEKADTEKYMSIAEDLQARLSASGKKASLGKRPGAEPFDTLERLCEQYYIYEGTENLQPKILKEVKSIVEGLRSDAKTQKGVEAMLDRDSDGVMSKLRSEFPSWKEEDFLLYSFAAAGFSSTTISTLMEKDKSVIYNRIWRLKGRISSSSSPLKEFFLNCLEK